MSLAAFQSLRSEYRDQQARGQAVPLILYVASAAWAECSKEAFRTGLDQLARALKNWGDSRTGPVRALPP